MRVIIVDDEPLSLTRMRQLLSAEDDIEIVAECAGGAEAIEASARLSPDVLFLDIQMPEVDGFEVLAAVMRTPPSPVVVFVTAFDEYAVRAFEVLALDYVLKPVASERLAMACARARAALDARSAHAALDERIDRLLSQLRVDGRLRQPQRLFVRTSDRVTMLYPADIRWVEAAGNYVRIHGTTGTYVVRETLTDVAQLLDDHAFVRIHRSTIVNLDHVKDIQPWYSGEMQLTLNDGTKLKLSRTYRQQFEARHRFLS